ncbi:uncharacterized protein LOC111706991 [Eurytemora carolleeae]|uniref:uncharacterized protein LOC111706991 n=1 Tax=Eurytemora carolleeae TaxID=1294199 RepID=UPI000C757EC4|nr:uncharacterized protein LOC111706991 [Eurytemora carolleeae]|eukprot:XP_023335724.1 uncharacterized protein LOC111706991 [Eurytemora affinis]
MCTKFLQELSYDPPDRDTDTYLKHLNGLWLESPVTFLHCCHEARMRKICLLPPPNEKHICVIQAKLALHDVVALTYYLEHFDQTVVCPESLLIQDCGLTDEALAVLGKKLWRLKKVQLTGCVFTHKGLAELTRKMTDHDLKNLEILDLSDCQLDDEALIRIMPVFGHLQELYISDNSFTWYGIRKLASVHRRTKHLAKLDMSRCQLSEHGFFELIPIILKTEHVILQGNPISPIELKIFSRQIRDAKKLTLKTLDISSSNLNDSCLHQISKFVFFIENVDLHNSNFGQEGLQMLVKCCEKLGVKQLKTLNLRMCKVRYLDQWRNSKE